MPHAAPSYVVPKSGWRELVPPHDAMSAFEFGSTGSRETSRFQGLSAGKTVRAGSGGGSVPGPGSAVTETAVAWDQADARPSAVRLRRERKEYVPAPASGTKVRLAAVW